jgi:hypothetical protein
MVTTALWVIALGIAGIVVGTLGLLGRLWRVAATTLVRNYAAMVPMGGFLVGMSLIGLLGGEEHPLAVALLILPTLAALGLGVWTYLVRLPRWMEPQWYRDMHVPGRRARR